jgi:uncharacterized membrane protein YfcA
VTELVEATVLGFLAGVLAVLFGIGGGMLFVAALTLVLGLGQLSAQATSLAAMIPVVLVGAWQQTRRGNVDRRAAATLGLTSILGVAAGAAIAKSLPEDVLRILFALLLLFIAVRLLWSLRRPPDAPEEPRTEI